MARYLLRRALQAIPLLLVITFLLFMLMQEMGDPLSFYAGRGRIRLEDRVRLTQQLGLDRPAAIRYLMWLNNMATGNWGYSLATRQTVSADRPRQTVRGEVVRVDVVRAHIQRQRGHRHHQLDG